jgi:hypothetical protein
MRHFSGMHSLVFVIVPEIGPTLETDISRLVEGGWRDFGTYETPCSCIGSVARGAAWKQVDTSPEGAGWVRDLRGARERQDAEAEHEILRRRYRRARGIDEAHPQYGRVDDECEICEGRGVNEFSRDPAQHHDWWVIGGRWDGVLGQVSGIAANVARLEDLPGRVCPAAIITPEGDWHAGPTSPANVEFREPSDVPADELAAFAEWQCTFESLAKRYRGHFAVAVDCHS